MAIRKFLLMLSLTGALLAVSCDNSSKIPAESKDVSSIIKVADDAVRSLNSVEFDVHLTMISPATGESQKDTISIKAKKSGINDGLGLKVSLDLGEQGTMVFNGRQYNMIDFAQKKIYIAKEEANPVGFILNNIMGRLLNFQISPDSVYAMILANAESVTFVGNDKINNEDVAILKARVSIPNAQVTVVNDLYFSKKSGRLLRMVDTTVYEGEQGYQKGVTIADFFITKENPELDDKIFDYEVKEAGWEVVNVAPQNQNPEGLAEGKPAPNWSLKDASGKTHSLSDFKGKVVVLDFWGTWCKWCVKAMPKIEEVHKYYKGKNVNVIGISCQEPADAKPQDFMKANGYTYLTVLNGEQAAQDYQVTGFPTLFVIDKNGLIIFKQSGFTEDMDKKMINLINKNL